MAQPVEIDNLDREQLLVYCRKLRFRHQAIVLFLKQMEVWDDYKKWLVAIRSRIAD